jgi:hypothetical protein
MHTNKGEEMYRRQRRAPSKMPAIAVLLLVMLMTTMVAGACGVDDSPAVTTLETDASSADSGASGDAVNDAGVAMAEKILSTYDNMTAKVAKLANQKIEPAALKLQLTKLYDSYMPKMQELNAEYLALQKSDEFAFRACNGHISTNRGPHISDAENAMVDAIKYYNLDLGDQEIVNLLTKKPSELLEAAIKQG